MVVDISSPIHRLLAAHVHLHVPQITQNHHIPKKMVPETALFLVSVREAMSSGFLGCILGTSLFLNSYICLATRSKCFHFLDIIQFCSFFLFSWPLP